MRKKAIILFNLGGPDSPEAVRPFLFQLFYDKNIISVPNPMRFFLAQFISRKREKTAREVYAHIGGRSPILEETLLQAKALETMLNRDTPSVLHKVFIVMRYWHPRAEQVVKEVASFAPDEICLLPLYPQFSTTTTQSSFEEWEKVTRDLGLSVSTQKICCYFDHPNFIAAHVEKIKEALVQAESIGVPHVLFSAHGLPEKIIEKGDPYQKQVEASVAAILRELSLPSLEYTICYQSRVGPLKWIGPSTEHSIETQAKRGRALIVVPIAFVSEHSETLVELDIEYKAIALAQGASGYLRVPALRDSERFIEALSQIVSLEKNNGQSGQCARKGKSVCGRCSFIFSEWESNVC